MIIIFNLDLAAFDEEDLVSLKDNLADEIKLDPTEEHTYYEKWLHTLANLVVERGLISEAELDQRAHEYATGARNDDDH